MCRDVGVAHAVSPLFMAFVWIHDPFICCSTPEPGARTACVCVCLCVSMSEMSGEKLCLCDTR